MSSSQTIPLPDWASYLQLWRRADGSWLALMEREDRAAGETVTAFGQGGDALAAFHDARAAVAPAPLSAPPDMPLSPPRQFAADLEAGDPEAVAIKQIVEKHGYRVAEGSVGRDRINAVEALRTVYRTGPEPGVVLAQVLTVYRRAWGPLIPTRAMLRGMAIFLHEYHPPVDLDRLAGMLGGVLPSQVEAAGRSVRGTVEHGISTVLASHYHERGRQEARRVAQEARR